MKRRLTRVYDTMTMPDGCAHRIEQKLQQELLWQETGLNTKVIAPTRKRRNSWAAAAAAVCLMLVLSVGGTMLLLRTSERLRKGSAETVTSFTAVETVPSTTPDDYYSLVTDLPAAEVESFAWEVRKSVLDENWEEFAEKVQYPIAIQDQTIDGDGGLVGLLIRNTVASYFVEGIRKESCAAMFCNQNGVCMGSGQLWINEVNGQLKITAINGLFTDIHDYADYDYELLENQFYAVSAYHGRAEALTIATTRSGGNVIQLGTGAPVVRNGDTVKTVTIPETVTAVEAYALANCPVLEAVYFRGNAPAEAEGVFDGSENVTVYYLEGTEGWGDTWCGRKTEVLYTSSWVSLGTVSLYPEVPEIFEAVLSGQAANIYGNRETVTLAEYCTALWGDVTVDSFTVVDMDDDGVCEAVLSVQSAEGADYGFVVLHLEDSEICAYPFRYGKMFDLKKDGTFSRSSNGPSIGTFSLIFEGKDSCQLAEETDRERVPLADWHTYPCVRADLVLQSYENVTGTGWTIQQDDYYVYFQLLLDGSMDWASFRDQMSREGKVWLEEDGAFSVFDPDLPGWAMYGVLTNVDGIDQLETVGCYLCTEEKEYAAEARDLLSGAPSYWIDAHLPALGSMGRRVYTTEKVWDYLAGKEIGD